MTTGKRGFRAIDVDGRRLLWRVLPEGCPCGHPHSVVIVDASREGSVVRLSGPPWTGADGAIVPRLIADGARKALALGWSPGQGSGVFAHLGEHAGAQEPAADSAHGGVTEHHRERVRRGPQRTLRSTCRRS